MLVLSLPVLFSLIAEPLTRVADTAFVARLGAGPTAALGVATTLLSSLFWVFNFLGIGAQTAVARAHGATGAARAQCVGRWRRRWWRRSLAGTMLALPRGRSCTSSRRSWAPATRFRRRGDVPPRIRRRRAPRCWRRSSRSARCADGGTCARRSRIAVAVNVVNVVLDALLIFGAGRSPRASQGAAWATSASQIVGALWAVTAVWRVLGPFARCGCTTLLRAARRRTRPRAAHRAAAGVSFASRRARRRTPVPTPVPRTRRCGRCGR